LGIANPSFEQKEKIVRFIGGLNAEYILVDLGTGTSPDHLDFFNMSDEGIVVINPNPTAMHNAYEFVRSAIYRKIQRKFGASPAVIAALREFGDSSESARSSTMIEFFEHLCSSDASAAESIAGIVDSYRPHIVVNMASSLQDQRVAEIVQSACKKFLNVDLQVAGLVLTDPAIRKASGRLVQAEFEVPAATAPQQIREVMLSIMNSTRIAESSLIADEEKAGQAVPAMGLNHNLLIKGCELHIQTEDMGQNVHCIATHVFLDGKIILSTKMDYPEDLAKENNTGQVLHLMRKQHFDTIREIENGKAQTFIPTCNPKI
jgi:MinD-like ATPase involved in chromosome partitioning or flagellar assembly